MQNSTLRDIRIEMGVSGADVARALAVTKAAVSQVERRSRVRPDTFATYAVAITKAALQRELGREDVSPELQQVGLLLKRRMLAEQRQALADEFATLEKLLERAETSAALLTLTT